uniref:Uncharacterized protein n=1 Tax=Anguilla anguilla TaxID=7936 RepID=A0A0E9PE16_ANGAN
MTQPNQPASLPSGTMMIKLLLAISLGCTVWNICGKSFSGGAITQSDKNCIKI